MDHPDIVEAETAKTLASMTQISEVLIGKKDANKEKEHEEEIDERVEDKEENNDEEENDNKEEEVIEPKKVNNGNETDTDTSNTDSSKNDPSTELNKPVLNVRKRLPKAPPTLQDQRTIIERSEAIEF